MAFGCASWAIPLLTRINYLTKNFKNVCSGVRIVYFSPYEKSCAVLVTPRVLLESFFLPNRSPL